MATPRVPFLQFYPKDLPPETRAPETSAQETSAGTKARKRSVSLRKSLRRVFEESTIFAGAPWNFYVRKTFCNVRRVPAPICSVYPGTQEISCGSLRY